MIKSFIKFATAILITSPLFGYYEANVVTCNPTYKVLEISPSGIVLNTIKTKKINRNYIYIVRKTNTCWINDDTLDIRVIDKESNKSIGKWKKVIVGVPFAYKIPIASSDSKFELNGTFSKLEISSDDFAVIPKLNIKFKNTKSGQNAFVSMYLSDFDNNELNDTQTQFIKNLNLKYSSKIKFQYILDRYNAEYKGRVYFVKNTENNIFNATDNGDFASIDKNDTYISNRVIEGVSNEFNITTVSKSWFGVGTNESENNPNKTTIQSDIRQNTIKDLRFNRIDF